MKEVTVEKRRDSDGKERVRVRTVSVLPSRTQQQFAEQVDVNNIVSKYKKTGEWLHLTRKQGVYADVSNITDYKESVDKVHMAHAAFAALPSALRNRFQNDPAQLLAFLQDPSNRDEAISLGLIDKPTLNDDVKNDDLTTKTTEEKKSSRRQPSPKTTDEE